MSCDYYRPNTHVRVASNTWPRDPFAGQIGVVHSTYNDGGDMIHKVRFADNQIAEYAAHELKSIEAW